MVLYNIYKFIKNRFLIYRTMNNFNFYDLEIYNYNRKAYYFKTLDLIKSWIHIRGESKSFMNKRYKYIISRINDMKNIDISIRTKQLLNNDYFYNLIS